jgi:thymidine phosphorylase
MIKKAIARVVEQHDLSEGEMIEVMAQIMSGEATPAQIGAFITALRMKGETIDEITGAARVMRERATPIRVGRNILDLDRDEINIDQETILDVVGTGGAQAVTAVAADDLAMMVHLPQSAFRVFAIRRHDADVVDALAAARANVEPVTRHRFLPADRPQRISSAPGGWRLPLTVRGCPYA